MHNCRVCAVSLTLALLTCALSSAPALASASTKYINITVWSADPNPGVVGDLVTFAGAVQTNEEKGELYAWVDYGDGTSYNIDNAAMAAALKGSVQHTYAAAGIYAAALTVASPMLSASATIYVIVGRGTVVNPTNGVGIMATDINGVPRGDDTAIPRFIGGAVNLSVLPTRATANNANTDFGDPSVTTTVTGLKPSHTYAKSGIYVATCTALNGTVPVGKARKTLNVSSRDTGDSGALPDPPSASVTIKKLQGKFMFNSQAKPDSVSLSAKIALPAGFSPAGPSGNSLAAGIGNITDTVAVDAKGKASVPGALGRITKAKIKFPKLNGTAVGGELAQIDVTISLAGLSALGFDTEGITSQFRSDEHALKAASRQIQVDLLLNGVAYETLAPVQYKLSKPGPTGDSATGQFNGLPTRAASH
ncbi:MAG: hypothetical protein ABSE73_05275 [Planctomycetota bacterium]